MNRTGCQPMGKRRADEPRGGFADTGRNAQKVNSSLFVMALLPTKFSELLCILPVVPTVRAGYTKASESGSESKANWFTAKFTGEQTLRTSSIKRFSPLVPPFPPSSTRRHPAQWRRVNFFRP
jgi:hypothetical protein